MTTRYALYFVPGDESELAQFGFSMLGRDALGQPISQPMPCYPNHRELTQKASLYGFHATLKAPFRQKSSDQFDSLHTACELIASRHTPIPLAGLEVLYYRGFCALAFRENPEPGCSGVGTKPSNQRALSDLALDCVTSLEHCRAPLTEVELQRREPMRLTDRQRELLSTYGYPYVDDEFNFHMTLSARLEAENVEFVKWAGTIYTEQVSAVPLLDRLALCKQECNGATFRRVMEYRLRES